MDDWRIQRMQAWKIVEGFRGSKDMPTLKEFYGLPYDDEIADDKPLSEEDVKQHLERMANFEWPVSSKN